MKKRIDMRLDDESISYIEEIAKSRNISKTKAVAIILKEHLTLSKINSKVYESKSKVNKSLEKVLSENTWEISNLKNRVSVLESRMCYEKKT